MHIGWNFTGKHSSPVLANVLWSSGLRKIKAPETVDMGRLPEGCCRRLSDNPDDYETIPFDMAFEWVMREHFMQSSSE